MAIVFLEDIQLIEVKVVKALKDENEALEQRLAGSRRTVANHHQRIRTLQTQNERQRKSLQEDTETIFTLRKNFEKRKEETSRVITASRILEEELVNAISDRDLAVKLFKRAEAELQCRPVMTSKAKNEELEAEIAGLKEANALNLAALREAQSRVEFLQENPTRDGAAKFKELQARNDRQKKMLLRNTDERRELYKKIEGYKLLFGIDIKQILGLTLHA